MDYPKITIVTPVFNQVRYLEETIQSILSQGYPNLEYIIIDGGSTDGTVDIIKKYESNIAYWVSEPDSGMYDALQKGFDHSTGEIMGWINADDLFFPNAFFAIAKVFLEHPNVNWITSHHAAINEDGWFVHTRPSTTYCKYDFYLPTKPWHRDEIGQESTLWRRSLWVQAGSKMNTSMKLAGDYELWLRFFQYDSLYVVHSLFGIFRVRKGQLSSDIERYWEEADKVTQEFPLSKEEQKIINTYMRRLKVMDFINHKLKIFNGRKLSRIPPIEHKYFKTPEAISI